MVHSVKVVKAKKYRIDPYISKIVRHDLVQSAALCRSIFVVLKWHFNDIFAYFPNIAIIMSSWSNRIYLVHIQNVERQNVERQNIERQNVETQNVENVDETKRQHIKTSTTTKRRFFFY
jgi:hypothetical protein